MSGKWKEKTKKLEKLKPNNRNTWKKRNMKKKEKQKNMKIKTKKQKKKNNAKIGWRTNYGVGY